MKIKLFTANSMENLEQQMNEFVAKFNEFYINDVTFNVSRNFLPMTNLGEYQEIWYGMVSYCTNTEDDIDAGIEL